MALTQRTHVAGLLFRVLRQKLIIGYVIFAIRSNLVLATYFYQASPNTGQVQSWAFWRDQMGPGRKFVQLPEAGAAPLVSGFYAGVNVIENS